MQTFKWLNINIPPKKALYMVKSVAVEQKASIQKQGQTDATRVPRLSKRPWGWCMMIKKDNTDPG